MKLILYVVMLFGATVLFSQQRSWLTSDELTRSDSRDWLEKRYGCDNDDFCCASCVIQIFAPAVAFTASILSGFLAPICCPSCGLLVAGGVPCVVGCCAMMSVCHCIGLEERRMYPDKVRKSGMNSYSDVNL